MVVNLDLLRDHELGGYPRGFVQALEETLDKEDWGQLIRFDFSERIKGEILPWNGENGDRLGLRLILPVERSVYGRREGLQLRDTEVKKIVDVINGFWQA